ncbi:hypothetical protein DPMN_077659, partial [Dreissena polymorpha]
MSLLANLLTDESQIENRKSAMTLALKLFMNTRDVEEIVQKFCCPGDSEIQEVDNVHSGIEKATDEEFSSHSSVAISTPAQKTASYFFKKTRSY